MQLTQTELKIARKLKDDNPTYCFIPLEEIIKLERLREILKEVKLEECV